MVADRSYRLLLQQDPISNTDIALPSHLNHRFIRSRITTVPVITQSDKAVLRHEIIVTPTEIVVVNSTGLKE